MVPLLRPAAAALAVAGALLPGAAPAGAQAPATIAARLGTDPVVVGSGMARRLPPPAAGRVRLRIVRRATGRIHVAVVGRQSLTAAGGPGPYAQAVASRLELRGALLVTSGADWYVVTSHDADAAALRALRRAVGGRRAGAPLEARLLRAVGALAAVDPGAAADAPAAAGVPPGAGVPVPDVDGLLDEVGSTLRWVLVGLAVAIGAPFVVVALVLVARAAGRRRSAALDRADALAAARERLLAVGDGLRELDEREAADGASPEGRAAYARVLDRYDAADLLLRGEPPPRAVRRAAKALDEADAALARARSALVAPGIAAGG